MGLTVLPLLDAREGLREARFEDELEDSPDSDNNHEVVNKEVEKVKTNEKFQDLVQNYESASTGEVSVPSLFSYAVPEDKNAEEYEDKKKQRLTELKGICKSGPSNLCRATSVWKGNKDKEDMDRKGAEEKLKLLRSERSALKEGCPSEAKRCNYKLKLHEKTRHVPDGERKELEKT